jgi:hypothetical protein
MAATKVAEILAKRALGDYAKKNIEFNVKVRLFEGLSVQ